ncbi:MAG: DUF3127 domain-containing protein [Paramuribaculum sp.]|nr:DUF3127 domain-containing protein [Paramuribaculum sp.]MDE6322922.1 DUF3127 domain-containing protein [Paramuribaculum sp.]
MEIKGKIIVALPEMTGVSKSGNNWKKREYVLETQETYPKKVHFDFFGDRADQYPLSVGDDITLSFDIESREYNGRWYTSIRGWKAEKSGMTQPSAGMPPIDANMPPAPPFAELPSGGGDEDLPF